jgi:hypothetical protein
MEIVPKVAYDLMLASQSRRIFPASTAMRGGHWRKSINEREG